MPPLLREYASLEKRTMLVGQGRKFEIWSEDHWEKQRAGWLEAEATKQAGELPEELQTISL